MSDRPLHDTPTGCVHVVEDDQSTRRALVRLVAAAGLPVKDYATADLFLETPLEYGPACIVTDLRMPGTSGLELQQAIHHRAPSLAFVFISGQGAVPDAVTAFKAGAVDFLEKPVDPDVLLGAIHRGLAASRRAFVDSLLRDDATRRLARLTPRELEVCRLVGQGLLNKQVAAALGTSEKTVKTQRGRAMRKLQATSTADLVDLLRRAER